MVVPAPPVPTTPVKNSRRPVTAKDVAELAGVARPAVSVVLNGARSNTNIADSTRNRIIEAARELGYRPNLAARTMKSGRSHQVGVLVRNNSRVAHHEMGAHPLAYDFILGISEGLEEAGYMMSFVRLSDVDPEIHPPSSAFQGHLLDGLIVVSDVPAISTSRLESLVPHCIWVDSTVWHPTNCIRRDEFHAGRLAMEQVLALGYRDIICLSDKTPEEINQPTIHYSARLRRQGLMEVAAENGIEVEEWIASSAPGDAEFAARLAPRLRASTAVIVPGFYNAHRLSRHIGRHRLWPGEDFALACCEGAFGGESVGWGQLSRVIFRRFDYGLRAAKMMVQMLAVEESGEQVSLPSEVIQDKWFAGGTALPVP